MNDKYAIWNNTIKKQLPEAWNSNRSATPAKWSIKDIPCSQWEIVRTLPAEWGNNKSSPDMWHHVETPPCGWGTELRLRNGWGSPACRPPSVREASSRSNDADKSGSGIDFSAMARSGAGKLLGAARKAGSTAKNAAGNAMDYARSDDVRNKLNAVKDKAGTLADSAGSSLKSMKNSAGDFVYKYRPSKNKDTSAVDNELISVGDDSYEDTETAISSYTDDTEYVQDHTEGYEDNRADDSAYEQDHLPKSEEERRSARHSSPAWVRSASSNTYSGANNSFAPAYEAPVQTADYTYAAEKKSPLVFILLGIIGVLILGVGLLGGMLLMKNKNGSSNNAVTSDISVDNSAQTASSETTVVTADNAVTAAVSEASTTTTAVAVQKIVKEYKAGEITKYPQYIKVLKDNMSNVSSSMKFKGLYDVSEIGYALYDINEDNTPELVISAGNPDIYSIYGGDAVELTPFWGGNSVKGIFIYENGYIGMTSISGNGEGGTTYYRYDGGKELKTVDYTTFDLQTSESEYYHDGQLISEEEFEKITSLFGQKISVSSTPVTNISEIKSYIDQENSEKHTRYDPSAAGNDFSFSQGKTECTVNTESDDLNMRDKPSTNSEVILTIPKGAAVYEYGHNSEWSYISYNKGGTTYYGYASRKYIKEKGSKYNSYDTSAAGNDFSFSQNTSECKVNIESGDLNLRAEPSMNGEVIVLMPKGATVYEYGHNHVWSYISYSTGGTTYYGYANKQYLLNTNEKVQVVSCNRKGTINASKGEVAGFASSYVVDGGPSKLIRKTLDHGWHVTAVNYCNSKGILWYELYDTDDNDYYGWVDASFISFY